MARPAGSNPDWVKTSPASSSLKLPDEVRGADTALLVNSHNLVDSLIANLPDSPYMPRQEITDTIGKMKMENAQVYGWSNLAPDGSSQHATFTIRNFQWRESPKDTVRHRKQASHAQLLRIRSRVSCGWTRPA